MLNFLDKKTKLTISTILILIIGFFITDKTLTYKAYKKINRLHKKFCKDPWKYYE